jgi:GNAT superfamily N-acetyltransferase
MNMRSDAETGFRLRRAQREDAPALIELIGALAEFEKLPPPNAEEQRRLVEDGFGDRPRFEAWLGIWKNEPKPVGYAIFFETYSTFRAAPTLYLEDIFVLPEYRCRGIGSALLRHCIHSAHERGCARMEWTCLDWNRKAQQVYERLGARHLSEWYLYRLTREGMGKFLELAPRSAAEPENPGNSGGCP